MMIGKILGSLHQVSIFTDIIGLGIFDFVIVVSVFPERARCETVHLPEIGRASCRERV